MTQTHKQWILSTIISFVTGFAVVLLTEIDSITVETIETGAWIGIMIACVRAGVKAVLEAIATRTLLK